MPDKITWNPEKFVEQLARYSDMEQQTIAAYFALVAGTRKTGKIADGVLRGELTYWERFPVSIVLDALRDHIRKYPSMPEKYTRGIMRMKQKAGEHRGIVRQSIGALAGTNAQRGDYGQGDERNRYVSADDPLPI